MTKNPLSRFSTRFTPQSDPIPGSTQVANSSGGHAWAIDDWARLRRFLILGVDGGSYYATEQTLVRENANTVLRCIELDGQRTVDEIVSISEAGRNPKQQPVIFALAACAAADDPDVRRSALEALPRVCRIGTHLFLFAGYVEQFRGWGRGLRRAVASWYVDRDPDALAFQLIKYQRRDGWSHRDLLRLAKPTPPRESSTDIALRWAVGKLDGDLPPQAPTILHAHRAAQTVESPEDAARLVVSDRLPWEALQSEHLRSPAVWSALIDAMGLGALVRNLGRMTANGTLVPSSEAVERVVARVTDSGQIRSARLHPIAILSAMMTYRSGRGGLGRLTWDPVTPIIDALDAAFYASFATVEASGSRSMLALDVSGSMDSGVVAGVQGLTPRVASAAMAAITLATEPKVETVAFTSKGRGAWESPLGAANHGWSSAISPLNLSSRQRLDNIVETVSQLPFGGTDCALPMLYALDRGLAVDTFVIYTDSETWAGSLHPSQALRQYRERTGIAAKLIVVGMVSNGFSIADPNDAGMLDVVGFDTAAPQLMADFAAGRL
ncbi:MAG TPA: TROVE domain-containing protein [Microthrixaceae bacterium]|nr:TROVE domain-containing protein [Microthrixaceae bacterium]HMT26523.1 TROVE domain-containing protein [Microthrixaceae bacterium]HMT62747.1 TROVE domain-containing protein [Microthrixaceae bacterium]